MKNVLLVEDNADDVLFMKMACERSGTRHSLSIVNDGHGAVDYLSGNGDYADRSRHPLPDLIFLDIKLPGRSGHEVLEWLRAQPGFKSVPVIMLTNSELTSDIERAYLLGATSYLVKNGDMVEFHKGMQIILKFWLEINRALE